MHDIYQQYTGEPERKFQSKGTYNSKSNKESAICL